MSEFIRRHRRVLFYAAWFVFGFIQALFTELQDDEAYYWVYARFLDWGYFDHPPLTALLIKAGGVLFGGEIGVRLFPLVLNTLTLLITESLVKPHKPNLFFAVVLSAAVLQIIGFWAVPDVPLLFFTALFFWCYRRFIQQASFVNIVLLALTCALLMYTKYHGALIILLTLLSNIKLLTRWPIYVAGAMALALYVPHLWWQYNHNWISFRYHLFESNVNPYKFSYTTDYLAGQLLIAGPLAGVIFLWATFKYVPKNALEKALKFTGVGILLFFLLSSFKGKVEANWTAPAIIPMLVLTYHFVSARATWRNWLYRLLPFSVALAFIFRLLMVVDIAPVKPIVQKFHAWKGWPQKVEEVTKGLPIVFNNSYQRASKIWFYTGQPAYSLNSYQERRNNYNYWPVEDSFLGKPVYVLDIYNLQNFSDSLQGRLWKVGYAYNPQFLSFARVMITPEKDAYNLPKGAPLQLTAKVVFPQTHLHFLKQNPGIDLPVKMGVFQKRDWVKDILLPITLQQLAATQTVQLPIELKLPRGDYFLRIAVGTNAGWFTHNSDKIKVSIR